MSCFYEVMLIVLCVCACVRILKKGFFFLPSPRQMAHHFGTATCANPRDVTATPTLCRFIASLSMPSSMKNKIKTLLLKNDAAACHFLHKICI